LQGGASAGLDVHDQLVGAIVSAGVESPRFDAGEALWRTHPYLGLRLEGRVVSELWLSFLVDHAR
jgi:hypothetical protein